ncbi:hypothetical protein HD553DRAFT_338742 [Filobasidium floriforme]|uniref:uncharacterized protein n=1 Tax=Filobasidium floriforme TaxID=5210 RepID=UPI001E8D4FDC|nr:uncharacterized protein HD553DRAFT_338742 [Filobasidium floriforme]KAH8089425.1 hypothetical protein HD553DRAFT_338742 [Filobasidium floriforme]
MSEYHHHHHPHQQQQQPQQQQQQQHHVQRDWSQHEREYYASLSDFRTFQQPLPHPNHHHGQYPYPSPIGEGPRGYLAGPAGTLVAPSTQGHPQTAEFGGTRDMSPLDSPVLTSINALPSLPAAPAILPAQAATPTSAPGNPPANQNVRWYEWMEDLLADLLVAEVKVTRNKVTMGMPVFSKIANLINEAMDARTDPTPNGRLDGIKVKNKTGILTAEFYKPLERMRKRSGWGWDHQLHRPLVDDEAFEDYVKHWVGTPTVSQIRRLRDNGWRLYPKWKIIREGHGATGDFAFRGGAPIPSQPEPPAGEAEESASEGEANSQPQGTPQRPHSSRSRGRGGSSSAGSIASMSNRRRDEDQPDFASLGKTFVEQLASVTQQATSQILTRGSALLKEDIAAMEISVVDARKLRLRLAKDRTLAESYAHQSEEDRRELLQAVLEDLQG